MEATTQSLPALGAAMEGGKFAGITTGKDGKPYMLVLLDSQFAGVTLNWKDALAWCAELGHGADLPNRVESAMLFANLKSEFAEDWYWTNEHQSGWAWYQCFSYGYQGDFGKSSEFRARAVRRLPFSPSVI